MIFKDGRPKARLRSNPNFPVVRAPVIESHALVGEDITVSKCPGKRHGGIRDGRRTYESPPGFVENRANRSVRPRRYECDRTTATIGRPDGNPACTVIAADGR